MVFGISLLITFRRELDVRCLSKRSFIAGFIILEMSERLEMGQQLDSVLSIDDFLSRVAIKEDFS